MPSVAGSVLVAPLALVAVAAQDPAGAVMDRVDAHLAKRDLRAAGAELDAALALQADHVGLRLARADVALRRDDPAAAIADCDHALGVVVPKGKVLVEVGGGGAAAQVAAILRTRGRARGQLGDWTGALRDLADACKAVPDDARLWQQRAHAEHNVGRIDDMVASLGKAVDVAAGGERAGMLRLRSAAHLRRGDAAAAAADVEQALRHARGAAIRADLQLEAGLLATALREPARAVAAFDAAAAGGGPLAEWGALMRWANEAGTDLAAASSRLRGAFAKPPADPLVRELLALCVDGTGDVDGMPLADRDTTARCPLWFFAGVRAAAQRRDADALRHWRRCVNTGRPDYGQWRIALRWLEERAGATSLAPSLGVEPSAANGEATLRVGALPADGAAAIQGLLADDVVVSINGQPATPRTFTAVAQAVAVGTPVRLTVRRRGAEQVLRVTAGVAVP